MTEFEKIDCSTVFKDALNDNGNREEGFRFEGRRLKAMLQRWSVEEVRLQYIEECKVKQIISTKMKKRISKQH